MKKLKKLELNKFNFHPDHRVSYRQMGDLQGGGGCICWNNPLGLNDGCLCHNNPFGLCSNVQGKPDCPSYGGYGDLIA